MIRHFGKRTKSQGGELQQPVTINTAPSLFVSDILYLKICKPKGAEWIQIYFRIAQEVDIFQLLGAIE